VTAPAGYHPLSGTPGARFKRIVGCRDMDVRCPGLLLGAAMRLAYARKNRNVNVEQDRGLGDFQQ
jgi:hypothetical protein